MHRRRCHVSLTLAVYFSTIFWLLETAALAQGPVLYQLGGTQDPAAEDGEAKTLAAEGIYCWWVGPPVRPGYFEIIARARTLGAPGVLHFVVVDNAGHSRVSHAISRVQRGEVTGRQYEEIYCGTFYWDGSYPLRVSDWSSGGLMVDWVKLVPVSVSEVRDPLPGILKRYDAPRFPEPPTVDGDLRDWAQVPPLALDEDHVRSAAYGGSADLSATARFAWDDTRLYFACEVNDDEAAFLPDARNLSELWQFDSIQLAFDGAGDARTPGYAPDDYEYGFGLTSLGPRAYRWVAGNNLPVGDVPTLDVAVVRDENIRVTRYEVAIPFKELLPFSPATGRCGMTFLVNDRDHSSPQRDWAQWTPGIAGAKDPSAFGELRLLDAPPAFDEVVLALLARRDISDQPTAEVTVQLRAPQALGPCLMEWTLRPAGSAETQPLASGQVNLDLTEPEASLPLTVSLNRIGRGRFVLSACLRQGDRELASADAQLQRFGLAELNQALEDVNARLAAGLEAIERIRVAGGHAHYPRATLGAVEEFARFVSDDLKQGRYERAEATLADLHHLLAEAETELAEIAAHPETDLPVPPLPRQRVTARDGAFYSGDEPHLLFGYCGWWDLWTATRRLAAQGLNHLQDSIIAPFALFPDSGEQPNPKMLDGLRWAWQWADEAGVVYSRMLACDQVASSLAERYPSAMGGGWGGKCTLDPGLRELQSRYLRTVAAAASPHWSAGVYILYGENTHGLSTHPLEVAAFARWLQEDYGLLSALNEAWGTDFASWEEIGNAQHVSSPVAWHDRGRFAMKLFTDWTAWLQEQVRSVDPAALCTGYPSLLSWDDSSDFSAGIDMEALCRVLNVNGFDTAALDYGGKRWAMSSITGLAMPHDMARAFNPRNPNFDPEFHLVNLNQRYPDEYIRAALFQGCLHGMSAANLWVFERSEGMDSMLVFQPRVMAAYLRTVLDLRRLVRPILAFQQAPSQVALLYSLTSVAYDPQHLPEMRAAYEGTFFSDTKVSFVTERSVMEGALDGLRVLIIPAAGHVPQPVAQNIADWARQRGKLILIGPCLERDPRNRPLQDVLAGVENVLRLPAGGDPDAYRAALEPVLDAVVDRPYRAVDASGTPLMGVEMRTVETQGGLLIYALNMNKTPVTFDLSPRPQGTLTELRSQREVALPLELKPLEIVLLRAQSSSGEMRQGCMPSALCTNPLAPTALICPQGRAQLVGLLPERSAPRR